ncbi:MAG: hypothetical protein M1839_005416 [Geoglossum umbratile]|nr:MAG: hypothetical protein M1839_005416 [Geoglossum umbratile]
MAAPPIPPQLPLAGPLKSQPALTIPSWTFPFKIIRGGCWLVNYEPTGALLVAYDGTIRIEHNAGGTTASGDLYQRPIITLPSFPPLPPRPPIRFMLPPPSPTGGIPIQSRRNYRYYLRITSIPEISFVIGNSFNLGFEMWRFNTATNAWASSPEATLTATMSWVTAPAGYPGAYLEGSTKNAAGAITGRLKMGWISESYRKITVEIDTAAGSERPLDNGAGETWATVFSKAGFSANVILSDTNVPTPADGSFSDAEMHAAMLSKRDPTNLDTEWHYHILAVHHIESTERGKMYDYEADTNNVPREGLGIASHWIVDNDPRWGDLRNTRWGASKPAYFRTAVHELGHAFGLEHNEIDNGYMSPSPTIASQPGGPFPKQVKWAFADDDLKRLRHWSDVFVRPGGLEYTAGYDTGLPITPDDLDIEIPDLKLEVKPVLTEVPLGAPVRVELKLTNNSKSPIEVPESIGFESPYISGTVTSAAVAPRTFKPFVCCTDSSSTVTLNPEDATEKRSLASSLTLLRGAGGALFPVSGVSEIKVTLNWPLQGTQSRCVVTGSATVFVTTAIDASHASAAHKMLTTPDAYVLLVLGGDCNGLKDGKDAINLATNDGTLYPHYAAVKAKCLATRFQAKPNLEEAQNLLNDSNVILSNGERAKLEKLGLKCRKKGGY